MVDCAKNKTIQNPANSVDNFKSPTTKHELEYEINIEKAISQTLKLLSSPQQTSLDKMLAIFGKTSNINHAAIFDISTDSKFITIINEWCNSEFDSIFDQLNNIDISNLKWFMGNFYQGNNIILNDLEDLSPESYDEKIFLQSFGFKSIAAIPITTASGKLTGYITFATTRSLRTWHYLDIHAFSSAAEMISVYRDRIELEKETLNQASFFKLNPQPMLIADLGGAIISCNSSSKLIFGKNTCGEKIYDLFAGLDKISLENTPPDEEFQVEQNMNNQDFIITVKKSDRESSFYLYFTEITIRKKIEKALVESEEMHRNVIERANDGIVIIQENKLKYINPRMAELIGYDIKEALDKPFINYVHPDEIITIKTRYKFRMQGKPVSSKYETKLLRKNGQELQVEFNIGLINFNNKIAELVIIRDITERKMVEEALLESEEKYRMLIENANEGIVILQDNRFKYHNSKVKEMTGYSKEELTNSDFSSFIHPADLELVMAMHFKRMSGESIQNVFEFRIIDKQKNTIWIQTSSVKISWQGQPASLGFFTDVTEQHHSRDKLIQSDKLAAIGTLAAGVAHEINNPIGYIKSNLNSMMKYVNKMEKFVCENPGCSQNNKTIMNEMLTDFKDAINESLEGSVRVSDIVSDLKSFSRVDSIKKTYADINEGINSTLNIVWNELKYKCIVERDLGKLPEILCIPNQINQVFMNILLNAGQAIDRSDGLITIQTRAQNKNIYISIKDNGAGIEESKLKKIFEPFYTTKEVGKGTGLGLSLAYDIIKEHKGSIEVESEVGKGTEFIITLPQGETHNES